MTAQDEPVPSAILLERPAPGVALVRLNRPAARNSLTFEVWHLLDEMLVELEQDPTNKCVIIAGSNGYFSAGGDLKTRPNHGFRATAPADRVNWGHRTLLRLRASPLTVIAAVEGGAIGAGWSLALACDLVFASVETKFAAPFVSVGVVPDGGIGWFLTQRLGRHCASAILLQGKVLSATEACEGGLVNRVLPVGEVESAAIQAASELPSKRRHAIELTKSLIDRAEAIPLTDFLRFEVLCATLTQLGPEAEEARASFTKSKRILN